MTQVSESTAPRHRPARGSLRAVLATVMIAVCMTLTGCGLRLETSLPVEPTPDASEALRQAMVADILTTQAIATALAKSGDLAAPVASSVASIITQATTQLTALGGVYESGLPLAAGPLPASASPSSPDTAAAPSTEDPATDLQSLVTTLATSATRARGSLASAPDALQARLYASVAASQMAQAETLAATAKLTVPSGDFLTALQSPETLALPANAPGSAVSDLIASEDAVGYVREIFALQRLSGRERTTTLARAVANRTRATSWAVAAGLDGTADDPRQVLYPLDAKLTSTKSLRARLVSLRDEQTHRISALFTVVDADQRAATADLLADSYLDALAAGAAAEALPGLTEYTAS